MSIALHPAATELRENTGLPWCFIEELANNGLRPDVRWARGLLTVQTAKQQMSVLDPLRVHGENLYPYVCYHTTVIFYDRRKWERGRIEEIRRVDLEARTWPRISFVERWDELWEVGHGRAFMDRKGFWWWEHRCWRNTDLARHFRGACDRYCRPCRQLALIAPFTRN